MDFRSPIIDVRSQLRVAPRALQSARSLATRNSKVVARGFTLTELLITIALIVMMIAIAVPAFRFLTGGRSMEAASNVIAPALGQARANAIGIQKVRGAVFFREATTDRAAVVLVEQKTPLVWTDGATYAIGDWVYVTTATNAYYVCKTANTAATASNKPGTSGGNTYWDATSAAINTAINNGNIVLDVVPGSDRTLLPVGIGVVGIMDSSYALDRPGTILFDGYGVLTIRTFAVSSVSVLGKQLGMTADDTGTSQIGLMLFDREGFNSAADQTVYINDNATPVLINRYNGTLVKGE